jgi:EF-hand domain-containing family member B
MQPSVFTLRGINEKDFLLPRPKDEIKTIFKNIGVDLTDDLFNSVWEHAAAQNPYGEVSVEEFRSVLDKMKSSTGKLI